MKQTDIIELETLGLVECPVMSIVSMLFSVSPKDHTHDKTYLPHFGTQLLTSGLVANQDTCVQVSGLGHYFCNVTAVGPTLLSSKLNMSSPISIVINMIRRCSKLSTYDSPKRNCS